MEDREDLVERDDHERPPMDRRSFLARSAVGLAAAAGGATLLAACGGDEATTAASTTTTAAAARSDEPDDADDRVTLTQDAGCAPLSAKDSFDMRFIQFTAHTVPAAWSQGIEEVLREQEVVSYDLLDGQADAATQVSLMDAAIADGADVIFLQPVDSVGIGPSIRKAADAGIPVITLNIDSTQLHAAHVEMNHYYGAREIARALGDAMGGAGKVAILNAPPGIIIRDLRTDGFVDGLAEYHPDIEIVADQVADWSRAVAQDVFTSILAANSDLGGAYGVNDSMALGAVDVAKEQGILDQLVVFGNDGETAAIESIEAGELAGTQYTDVFQQGRFAASAALQLATARVNPGAIGSQGHILMPFTIVTSANAGDILPAQRW